MEEITRERMDVDVLIVGAGPSSLAFAYHLAKQNQEKGGSPLEIAILEKCREPGDSILSGAVMDPRGIEAIMPDWKEQGAPIESEVTDDKTFFLTQKGALKFPITPPPLRQHGYYVISLSKFVRWMSEKVQELGIMVFPGFPGKEVLYDGNKVVGVRTGDKGIDKNGERKANFEPGIDIHAKLTIFAEGVRGSLTRDHIKKLNLDEGRNPPNYATGVKEVWEVKPENFPKGMVYHTMGFPAYKGAMGGGWVYGMGNNMISLGGVTWLSYKDPYADPHRNFQKFKTHPLIKKILEGGKMVQYGAKAVSVGGYYSIPKFYGDGFMMIGESANMVDGQRLKGVHLAMISGKMAADTALEAFQKGDFSEATLKSYSDTFENSVHKKELMLSRNFHQAFDSGFFWGMVRSGIQAVLRGRDIFGTRIQSHSDRSHVEKVQKYYGQANAPVPTMKFDNQFLYDKLTDVYNAGSIHEEDQPSHLVVPDTDLCSVKCAEEFGNPCQHFCPAQVYEIEQSAEGKKELKLNPSNCVHCKTCDIMDPYTNITWVTPEGGGGPQYTLL